jgi:aspartate/methionine/tyrosine aminotransferase
MLAVHKGVTGAVPDRVMVTCGANQAFANVLFTVTQPGDEVITFGPGYFDHGYTIRLAGCTEVEVALVEEAARFRFDIDAVQRAIGPRTRCVVLVSPGNPTGAVAPRAFVQDLCALCRERGLWLISDETYDMLTFAPAEHWSPARVDDHERVIVLGTFSKMFAMAGWRLGYFYAHEQVVDEAFKVQDALVVCAPVPAQHAVLAALPNLEDYVARLGCELRRRRDALLEALTDGSVVMPIPPEGATFALARIRGGGDDVAFCESLLEQTGVVTVPGSAFGVRGAGMLRLSFGNQPVNRIVEAGERLRTLR